MTHASIILIAQCTIQPDCHTLQDMSYSRPEETSEEQHSLGPVEQPTNKIARLHRLSRRQLPLKTPSVRADDGSYHHTLSSRWQGTADEAPPTTTSGLYLYCAEERRPQCTHRGRHNSPCFTSQSVRPMRWDIIRRRIESMKTSPWPRGWNNNHAMARYWDPLSYSNAWVLWKHPDQLTQWAHTHTTLPPTLWNLCVSYVFCQRIVDAIQMSGWHPYADPRQHRLTPYN
jgi:hypothetical protein